MTTRDEWIEHHVEDVLFDVDAEDTTEHRQLAKAYLRDAMAFADAHPVVESAFEKPVRGIIAEVGNVTYSPTPEPAGAVDAPSRIYLQHDPEDTGEPFTQAAGVTWCQDRINATDIEYVRADQTRQENKPFVSKFIYNRDGSTEITQQASDAPAKGGSGHLEPRMTEQPVGSPSATPPPREQGDERKPYERR